jgi:hypothetical protein
LGWLEYLVGGTDEAKDPGTDRAAAARPSAGNSQRSTPGAQHKAERRFAIALALVLVGGAAGIAHAAYHSKSTQFAGKLPPCTAPVKVNELLTIHPNSQPMFLDLKEQVSLRTNSGMARALLGQIATEQYPPSSQCFFPNFFGTPVLTSSANGLTNFTASLSTRNNVPTLQQVGNWAVSLHKRSVNAMFIARKVCAAKLQNYLPNWTGTKLTLTVVSTVPPSHLSPLPDSHAGHSYTWYHSKFSCQSPPKAAITTPASLLPYAATAVRNSTVVGESGAEIIGWSGPLGILLLGFIISIRNRQRAPSARKYVFGLLYIATLALTLATVDLGYSHLERVVAGIIVGYGLTIAILLRARLLASLAMAAVTVGAAVLLFLYGSHLSGPFSQPSNAMFAVETAALILALATAILIYRKIQSLSFTKQVGATQRVKFNGWLNSAIFFGFASLLLAAAYCLGNISTPVSAFSVQNSEPSVLRYCLAPFAILMIAIALVIPLANRGPASERRIVTGALLGFAAVAQLPTIQIAGISLPIAELVFMAAASRIVSAAPPAPDTRSPLNRLRTCRPKESDRENIILAIKIAGVLSVVPVAYFTYTAITTLPSNLEQPGPGMIFVFSGILVQLGGWILIGLVFACLNTRLPGMCGPVRALSVTGIWFAVAFACHIVQGWLGQASSGQSWSFFGLQLLLFLTAFSVIWDACILDTKISWSSPERLRQAYNLQRSRAVIVYTVPVLLTVIALGQQVATGNGVEFVKSALSIFPAVFAG